MERTIFADAEVRQQLTPFARIKFDLTQNTADQREWLSSEKLFGPPAFLFLDTEGHETLALRVMGETDKATFLEHVSRATPDNFRR